MADKMLISIITINFNNLDGLKKTMSSVFNQSWKEFEYIVIDGGSTDGSAAYIENHKDKIDYWVSEPDKGVYNAMNKAIKVAKGDYLLFLNSGDHFYENLVLERNYKFINNYDLIYFNIKVVTSEAEHINNPPDYLVFSYFINDTLPHQTTFIRASLFEKVGYYDESLKIVSDWKFFVESICKFNASYLKVENVLATHYLDGLSASPENWPVILEERNNVLESGFKVFMDDNRQLLEYRNKHNESMNLISKLRNSRKINFLVKLGLLKNF
tara:strand:+ start:294 stop:1103 length:810 start_codon:yes stop_codon:yes gene_type:complete